MDKPSISKHLNRRITKKTNNCFMKTSTCVLFTFFLSLSLIGQVVTEIGPTGIPLPPPPPLYDKAHNNVRDYASAPMFPDGYNEMEVFIRKNLVYPEAEKQKGLSGYCFVDFFVETDGSLTDIHILKSSLPGSGFDKEAMRIVKIMPKWIPSKMISRPIATMASVF